MATDFGFNDSVYTVDSFKGKELLLGRVTKVITSQITKQGKIDPDFTKQGGYGALGSIKYDIFQGAGNLHEDNFATNNYAKPLFGNIKQYPVVGEIVILVAGPSTDLNEQTFARQFYYISAVNIWNNTHHNAFPDLVQYSRKVSDNISNQDITQGATKTQGDVDTRAYLGDYFQEKSNIKPLLAFEGDFILEGRWGQSVRFGSTTREQSNLNRWSTTGSSGDPITIISNQRASSQFSTEPWVPSVENLNRDGSAIWLTSNQSIDLDVSKYPLDTFRLGYRQNYGPDTVQPLAELSPGIQTIASQEQDKQVLANVQ